MSIGAGGLVRNTRKEEERALRTVPSEREMGRLLPGWCQHPRIWPALQSMDVLLQEGGSASHGTERSRVAAMTRLCTGVSVPCLNKTTYPPGVWSGVGTS
ncbi:hypothetical protein NDU88_006233 [Pleurodeles waltl]|uniref:Uncharacterized protein n=1 Tax=Pleurodeles waltl TaxID=8319 RepID=A0AAV7MBM7_PLEWA|nr:hypothetical protein NDU88_006233 [Pleurodeles waltl]